MANGKQSCCFGQASPHAWGLTFVLLGAYFLAVELGVLPRHFSILPIASIVLGIYLLPGKRG